MNIGRSAILALQLNLQLPGDNTLGEASGMDKFDSSAPSSYYFTLPDWVRGVESGQGRKLGMTVVGNYSDGAVWTTSYVTRRGGLVSTGTNTSSLVPPT